MKYAYDGDQTIHFVATEDHPRNYDNSLYHGYLRDGKIYDSFGTQVGKLSQTTEEGIEAWDLTKIFPGDPDNVAWMTDIKLIATSIPTSLSPSRKTAADCQGAKGATTLLILLCAFF